MRIPLPALAPAGGNNRVARRFEIFEDKIFHGIQDNRAGWHLNDRIFRAATVSITALARRSRLCLPMFAMCRYCKVIDALARSNDHAATATTIAPVRAAPWHISLATKAHTAVSPTARFDLDLHSIDEHDGSQ